MRNKMQDGSRPLFGGPPESSWILSPKAMTKVDSNSEIYRNLLLHLLPCKKDHSCFPLKKGSKLPPKKPKLGGSTTWKLTTNRKNPPTSPPKKRDRSWLGHGCGKNLHNPRHEKHLRHHWKREPVIFWLGDLGKGKICVFLLGVWAMFKSSSRALKRKQKEMQGKAHTWKEADVVSLSILRMSEF